MFTAYFLAFSIPVYGSVEINKKVSLSKPQLSYIIVPFLYKDKGVQENDSVRC